MVAARFGNRYVRSFVLLGLMAVGLPAVQAQEKQPPDTANEPSIWMQKKLDYSRNILAGLATEDYDQIIENAQAMQGMSRFEGYIRNKVPGYRSQLQIFQSANEDLIRQAKNANVEGATLSFTQLTLSCVNCLKQLRAGVTSGPQPIVR